MRVLARLARFSGKPYKESWSACGAAVSTIGGSTAPNPRHLPAYLDQEANCLVTVSRPTPSLVIKYG